MGWWEEARARGWRGVAVCPPQPVGSWCVLGVRVVVGGSGGGGGGGEVAGGAVSLCVGGGVAGILPLVQGCAE